MKKVTNGQYEQTEALYERLSALHSRFESLSQEVGGQLMEFIANQVDHEGDSLVDLMASIEDVRNELQTNSQEIAGQVEAYRDERSERWKSSDVGEEYSGWVDCWGELAETLTEPTVFLQFCGDLSDGDLELDYGVVDIRELPNQTPND